MHVHDPTSRRPGPAAGMFIQSLCVTCNQPRQRLGGTLIKGTRLFRCAGCTQLRLAAKAAHAEIPTDDDEDDEQQTGDASDGCGHPPEGVAALQADHR